jgi:hypothetical protein
MAFFCYYFKKLNCYLVSSAANTLQAAEKRPCISIFVIPAKTGIQRACALRRFGAQACFRGGFSLISSARFAQPT